MSTVPARALNGKTETYPLLTVAQIDRLRAVRTGREALRREKSCIAQEMSRRR